MKIGEVRDGLKQGKLFCRKGWNGKGMFICAQVPSHIGGDIIPRMTSLYPKAKEVLLATSGEINYENQLLIVKTSTGKADSWIPSSSDFFAEDWEEFTDYPQNVDTTKK